MAAAAFIEARTTEATLRDGTRILLRPVVPEDKQVLLDAFERLSPKSRYRRFMSPIEELAPEMLRQLTELDYVDRFAWVALAMDEPGRPGAGVARYVRSPEDPAAAEAAVTVIDAYQGRGLGTLLLQVLGAVALENGIKRFRGYALEENRPIRELMLGMGASVHHDAPGMMLVEVDLPAQAEELRNTPGYRILRAVARGEGPRFRSPIER